MPHVAVGAEGSHKLLVAKSAIPCAAVQDADKFKEAKLLEKKKAKARREGMSNAEFERNVMSPEREADKFKFDFDDEKAIVHASQMLYQQCAQHALPPSRTPSTPSTPRTPRTHAAVP